MAGGAIAGGVLGAVGDIVAAEISKPTQRPGNQILPFATPSGNPANQGATFDALSQLGLGSTSTLGSAGPVQDLMRQAMSLPISEKDKRRAIIGITNILNGQEPGYDVGAVLLRLGLDTAAVNRIGQDQKDWEKRVASLKAFGDPLQEQIAKDRLTASADVASLLSGVSGSGRQSPLVSKFEQQYIRDQTRGLAEAEEQALISARFGGFNPAAAQEQIARQRGDLFSDADLFSLQKALQIATGVDAALGGASARAQGAAGISTGAGISAASIAGQQAMAANNLAGQLELERAANQGTAISSAFQKLGDTATTYGLLRSGNPGSTSPAAGSSGGYTPTFDTSPVNYYNSTRGY